MDEKSVFEYILLHQQAFNERLNLVPSENSLSVNARLAFLTDVLNRYYFPLDRNHPAFPGNEFIERIYERCRELLAEAAGARFINIRPISGLSAMTIAFAGLTRGGDTVATFSPANGGHTITAALAGRLGVRLTHLPYLQEEFCVDISALPDFISRERVSLIYLDQQHILFPHKVREMRAVIPPEVKIYYDGSHVMGLIFGKNFQEPLNEGATFLGGSTHKTIPGPHKAFIATNDEELYKRLLGWSGGFVSHDHGADVAALAIVLEEMRGKWESYAAQVIKNAQYFARRLAEKGFNLFASKLGFTKSHQLWIDIGAHMEAFDAAMALSRCNIIVNTYKLPAVTERWALRLGVQEVTYLGAKEREMEALADMFEKILITRSVSEEEIRRRVAEIKKRLLPPINRDWLEKTLEKLNGR
ncbi:MAG: hypothetical protein WAP51_02570 [Candidatus Sungiibacteriota bacterium]